MSFLGIMAMVASVTASCNEDVVFDPKLPRCEVPEMPSYESLPSIEKLPDPFKFMDGSRVDSRRDWECRRAEIAALAQEFQYGYKPSTPSSATTGSVNGDTLTVKVNQNGASISFNCTITYPTTGRKPYPAVIGIGASNLNNAALLNMGVAIINFPNNRIAEQLNGSSRGKGLFYEVFGSDHSASATMAWAWGVSRVIDALEKMPRANIDARKLGVTGCSRNGKGALVVGAFDERIKLTIPQEPGAGGAAAGAYLMRRKKQAKTYRHCLRLQAKTFGSVKISPDSATRLTSSHLTSIALWPWLLRARCWL
ncbi:hypothetical protein GCM10028895_46510 [Pontibacter rugosus]